ncbi:MAG TPA: hypothetical protein VGX52_19135 [Burkholderiales bacterium]|nr:hypothetical protein [Burkholderiales bacterium]
MLRTACLSAALLACAPALAQNYGGTYTAKNASGGTVTLTLAHDEQKRVSGTLTGHGRSGLHVQARVESDGLRGTAGNNFGMLYLTGRLKGEELTVVLTESDVGGKPNPQRASELRLARMEAKTAPQKQQLSQALTRNAWCSSGYDISGKRNLERLVFMPNGLVNQTPGRQARWRVQNETLEFSPDGISWSPQPLRLALSSGGSPVLQSHNKEYLQCD